MKFADYVFLFHESITISVWLFPIFVAIYLILFLSLWSVKRYLSSQRVHFLLVLGVHSFSVIFS